MQRDQKNGHVDYNVFYSKDIKYMAKVLGGIVELGVLAHVFAPFYNTPSGTRPSLPMNRKIEPVLRKIPAREGLRVKRARL